MTYKYLLFIICLVAHIVISVILYILMRKKVIKGHKTMFLILLFIPIWGVFSVIVMHIQGKNGDEKERKLLVEKLKLQDELLRSIPVETEANPTKTVPLEEALLVNNVENRRSLVMNLLSQNPENHVELLKQARMNEDAEVVHYAATAMNQISQKEEIKFRKLEERYSKNPDNINVIKELSEALEVYLERNIAEGRTLINKLTQYVQLMEKQLKVSKNIHVERKLGEAYLYLENYSKVEEIADDMIKNWSDREECWLLKIRCLAAMGKGNKIKETVEEIEKKKIYLSSSSMEVIDFWVNGNERNQN